MSNKLVIGLLSVAVFFILVVLYILKKGRMPMKYAIVWLIPSLAIIVLAVVPTVFIDLAQLFGFQTISNLIIGFFFVLLFFIIMALTVIIAGLTTKVNLLIQEISLLKSQKGNKKING